MPTCIQCEQSFEQPQKHNTTGRFCSRTCWYAWPGRIQDRECPACHKMYRPGHSQQKACGRECGAALRRTAIRNTHCARCGEALVSTIHPKVRFCSHSCASQGNHAAGVGIRPDGFLRAHSSGYTQIKVEGIWKMTHRHVMSQTLGRPLEAHERVHHKNGDRADNRPENLELWKVTKKDPAGVRAADYHCAGCRCFQTSPALLSIDRPQ